MRQRGMAMRHHRKARERHGNGLTARPFPPPANDNAAPFLRAFKRPLIGTLAVLALALALWAAA